LRLAPGVPWRGRSGRCGLFPPSAIGLSLAPLAN
jgi:hypothetical protein